MKFIREAWIWLRVYWWVPFGIILVAVACLITVAQCGRVRSRLDVLDELKRVTDEKKRELIEEYTAVSSKAVKDAIKEGDEYAEARTALEKDAPELTEKYASDPSGLVEWFRNRRNSTIM